MNRAEFHELFLGALEAAAELAEGRLGCAIPRNYEIEFHGLGEMGGVISVDRAEGLLYLGSDKFFKIIDISIKKISKNRCIVFVRPSGHAAVQLGETWNADGFGPFKQIQASVIEED